MRKLKAIMKNFLIPILIGVICLHFYPAKSAEKLSSAIINGKKINLEIAADLYSREIGLMFRDKLAPDSGMIFLFDQPEKVDFWMKNMRIPLDMIFISNNKIVKIYREVPACNAEPCDEYPSADKIDSVIEVNSEFCKKFGIKEGQSVKFDKAIINKLMYLRNQ